MDSGDVLAMMPVEAIDDSILRYNAEKNDKSKALKDNSSLAKVIEAMAAAGNTEEATALMDTLPSEGWPDSDANNILYYAIMAVLAVIAIMAVLLVLRSRGTVSFLTQRSVDLANNLDILESRVRKLGKRSLSDEIGQIRDNLREMGRR